MSFADNPLVVSDPTILPPKLYRMVEDDIEPDEARYGLIVDEKSIPGKKFIITQAFRYRVYKHLLDINDPCILDAKDTHFNPLSPKCSEQKLALIGVRGFDQATIPEEIMNSIEYIYPRSSTEYKQMPAFTHKEF